jgi:7-keto-8-aminopelargonate synthetase-like enzyme
MTRAGERRDNKIGPGDYFMARAKSAGNGRLEEALATLIQTQAVFLARVSEIDARVAEMDRINAERLARMDLINSERFARIEALLLEHNRILQALPDAIRDKIGFKTPPP